MPTAPLEPTLRARETGAIVFRKLTPADAAVAAEIIRAAFAAQSRQTDPPSSALRENAETISAKITTGGGVCVIAESAMVALALWQEKDGALHIGRLSVLPESRGRGIGRALIAECERQARQMGARRLSLNVRLALDDNERLFAACGFRRVGVASHPGHSEPTFAILEKAID